MPDEYIAHEDVIEAVLPPQDDDVEDVAAAAVDERELAREVAKRAKQERKERIAAEQELLFSTVAELGREVLAVRELRTKAYVDLLDIVKRMPDMSSRRKKAILIERFCLEAAEVGKLLANAAADFEFRDLVIKRSVAPATIDGLFRASQNVRALALADLQAGYAVSKSDLTRIQSDLTQGTPRAAQAAKKRFITQALNRASQTRLDDFMADVRALVAQLCDFYAVSEDGDELTRHEDQAAAQAGQLKYRFASFFDVTALLNCIERQRSEERSFSISGLDPHTGPIHNFFQEPKDKYADEDLKLANALDALERLNTRRFFEGFVSGEDPDNFLDAELVVSLAWLSDFDLTEFEARREEIRTHLWARHDDDVPRSTYYSEPAAPLKSIEICAGGGGQAIGLHIAGYEAVGLFEQDKHAIQTLNTNYPFGPLFEGDVRQMDFDVYRDNKIDLFAGGVPCQPYSTAGDRLGDADERDLFMTAVNIIKTVRPRAIMLENVRAFGFRNTDHYRAEIFAELKSAGYEVGLFPTAAENYGLAQARPRLILVGFRDGLMRQFKAPPAFPEWRTTVGEALLDLMEKKNWPGAAAWSERANDVGPTIVGASNTSGGQGFSSKFQFAAWERLGIDPRSVADELPDASTPLDAMPRLTLEMGARLQGFPDGWEFQGPKSQRRRQIANAFPPIVAAAFGLAIKEVLEGNGVQRELSDEETEQRALKFASNLAPLRVSPLVNGAAKWWGDFWANSALRELARVRGLPTGNVKEPDLPLDTYEWLVPKSA